MLEILVVYLESLALTHGDEKSLGACLTKTSSKILLEKLTLCALKFKEI